MAISKLILNGVTQMDVTQKTVTADTMLSGITALMNDGTDITGVVNLANAGTSTPLADSGNGSVGTSTSYAREDHVHPEPSYGNIVSYSVVEVTS